MPAPEAPERGGVSPVAAALPWAGVGLAVLGALLALLADGGALSRLATMLAALAAALVGLHQALRRAPSRVELEETVYAEADAVRADVRADVTTAVQAVHRAFGEKLQILYEQLAALQADAPAGAPPGPAVGRLRPPGGGMPEVGAPPAPSGVGRARVPTVPPSGVLRHTETVHVRTRQAVVGADAPRAAGEPAGGARHADPGRAGEPTGGWTPPRQRQPGAGPARPEPDDWRDPALPDPHWPDPAGSAAAWPDAPRGSDWDAGQDRPAGSVPSRWAASPPRWSGGERAVDDRPAALRPGEPQRRTGSWSGRAEGEAGRDGWDGWGDAGRGDGEPEGDDAGRWAGGARWDGPADWDSRTAWAAGSGADGVDGVDGVDGEAWRAAAPVGDGRAERGDRVDVGGATGWAGDRWAAMRVDDDGRELRTGERRARMDADDSGAEVRMEDRWAGVREQRPGGRDGRRRRDVEPWR